MMERDPLSLRRPALAIAISLALGGCATAPKPDAQFLARPLTVRLAQVSITDKDRVRSVIAPDRPKDDPEAATDTDQAIESAQAQALADIRGALAAFPDLQVGSAALTLPPELAGFPILGRDQPLSSDVLTRLRATCDADALLRFGISDYGLTPKAWRSGVITFEVVSTLGIAAIAYAKPATRAFAGAYLAQETVEETIEAYSGFWALDEVYRPVRVEAEMIDLRTGRRVWADSETGLSDRRLSRIYTTVTAEERKTQLGEALHEAITKVVRDFQQSAGRPAPAPNPDAGSPHAAAG